MTTIAWRLAHLIVGFAEMNAAPPGAPLAELPTLAGMSELGFPRSREMKPGERRSTTTGAPRKSGSSPVRWCTRSDPSWLLVRP